MHKFEKKVKFFKLILWGSVIGWRSLSRYLNRWERYLPIIILKPILSPKWETYKSLANENLIINAAEEKIQHIEDKLLDRDIEGLQIEEELLNAEIAKKYAAEQDSRARSDQLLNDLETFVDNMKPPETETVVDQPSNGNHAENPNAEILKSTNQIPDSPSVQKWSKLKALIIVGFATSVLTTFSDEISDIATDINTQIKDLVGVDIQENGELQNFFGYFRVRPVWQWFLINIFKQK